MNFYTLSKRISANVCVTSFKNISEYSPGIDWVLNFIGFYLSTVCLDLSISPFEKAVLRLDLGFQRYILLNRHTWRGDIKSFNYCSCAFSNYFWSFLLSPTTPCSKSLEHLFKLKSSFSIVFLTDTYCFSMAAQATIRYLLSLISL